MGDNDTPEEFWEDVPLVDLDFFDIEPCGFPIFEGLFDFHSLLVEINHVRGEIQIAQESPGADFIVNEFFAENEIGLDGAFIVDPKHEGFFGGDLRDQSLDGIDFSGSEGDMGIEISDPDDKMVFDFFEFFKEEFITEASIHNEDTLGGIIF